MISAIFDGAAHVTVAGCLGGLFFKQTVVDRTSKVVQEAENILPPASLYLLGPRQKCRIRILRMVSEFGISVAALVLASNKSYKTAQILLSKDPQPPPKHNLAELNALFI
jgi:hypothetical protein